jgi:hypothetical protein
MIRHVGASDNLRLAERANSQACRNEKGFARRRLTIASEPDAEAAGAC